MELKTGKRKVLHCGTAPSRRSPKKQKRTHTQKTAFEDTTGQEKGR